jgi:hypothetical protein
LIPPPSRIIRTIGLFVMDNRFDSNFATYATKMKLRRHRNLISANRPDEQNWTGRMIQDKSSDVAE